MKTFLLLAFFSSNLIAAERVLVSDTKVTDVTLNTTSVRCSAIGYRMPELKINIKALDGWTLFDHSNVRAGDFAGQPCMTAGTCKFSGDGEGLSIDDILFGETRSRVERIKVHRQIVEVKVIGKNENDADVCLRHIEERLQANVGRGDGNGVIKFSHLRSGLAENFPLSVCQTNSEIK